ncbi:MAG: UbiA family prenyltransferase [Elusimicrobiota bacterium]|jgi:protoheme IX farnesyltransferase
MRALAALAKLVKLPVSAAAGLSAFSASVAASGRVTIEAAAASIGVFILASGACALNECQEAGLDRLMERTRARPIPAGAISPGKGLGLAAAMLACGSALLLLSAGILAGLLGLGAAAWYNGVYTPLKKWSAFAVAPGALVGTLPPCIGWLAGGQALGDPRLLALAGFFYLWQVPHFWLLAQEHGPDLKSAGLPSAAAALGAGRVGRVAGVWLATAACATVLFPLFGTLRSLPGLVVAAGAACLLTWRAMGLLSGRAGPELLRRVFVEANAHALLVMALLCVDSWLA